MASVVPPKRIPLKVKFLGICPECNAVFSFRKESGESDAITNQSKYKCKKCGHSDSWTSYPKFVKF